MRSISWAALKKGSDVVAASSYAAQEKSQKRWCQSQRHTVQHSLGRHVRRWKRPAVSLYFAELLIQKCKFGIRFNVSSFCLERYSPKGSCHFDESSMNHTLAQKHLFELLMWNASDVQKTLQLNLTGEIERAEVYILSYGDHQLRLICAQVRHHSPAGTFSRVPRRCLRWSPTPPGPRWPPAKYRIFTSIQMVHTHTLLLRTAIANFVVGHILSAKTLPLHLTGMKRPENK